MFLRRVTDRLRPAQLIKLPLALAVKYTAGVGNPFFWINIPEPKGLSAGQANFVMPTATNSMASHQTGDGKWIESIARLPFGSQSTWLLPAGICLWISTSTSIYISTSHTHTHTHSQSTFSFSSNSSCLSRAWLGQRESIQALIDTLNLKHWISKGILETAAFVGAFSCGNLNGIGNGNGNATWTWLKLPGRH